MISIGLNLILGVLLFCALVLGLRLERKLRGLRQSHQDFAKAVGELDQAAGRTEQSLASLRAGTETAKNEVASRIDQARLACQRLEKLVADADKAIERAAAQPLLQQPHLQQPLALSQPIDRMAPSLAEAPSAIARPGPELLRPAAPVQTRPAPEPKLEPSRSRAKLVDDDLFAADDPVVGAPPVREAAMREPPMREPQVLREAPLREPAVRELQAAAPQLVADNSSRAEREAFYREVLDRGPVAAERGFRDPFEGDSRFANERRAMLAAVMGGRR